MVSHAAFFANPGGDACDPNPCVYYKGVGSINHAAGLNAYNKNMALRVEYRAVGYDAGQDFLHRNMDAYYCGCKNPVTGQDYPPEDCRTSHCVAGAPVSTDNRKDVGWHPLIGSANTPDSYAPPFPAVKASCTLVDLDGENPTLLNDCTTPVPLRLFRRPYRDSYPLPPTLGANPLDWEKYWTESSSYRTRDVTWDWRNQDYPHPDGTPYIPPTNHARVRLRLLLGRDAGGSVAGALAFDVASQTWSSLPLRVPDLDRVDSVGHSADGRRVFIFGGRTDGEVRDGLFEIELATLTGWRVDAPGSGPGPRAEAALQYLPATGQVYLYGGTNGVARGDVWRFDLQTRQWELLSEDGAPGGPQPSRHGMVSISPSDGAINVLPGSTEDGALQPAWQLRKGQWKSYTQLLDPES